MPPLLIEATAGGDHATAIGDPRAENRSLVLRRRKEARQQGRDARGQRSEAPQISRPALGGLLKSGRRPEFKSWGVSDSRR